MLLKAVIFQGGGVAQRVEQPTKSKKKSARRKNLSLYSSPGLHSLNLRFLILSLEIEKKNKFSFCISLT